MSEIVNTATIKVVADASGVETGMRTAAEAMRSAERAATQAGAGSAASSRAIETAQRSIIASIQRTTTAMEAGGRSTASYYELLGRQKGVDQNVLAPYIAQLRAVEEAQARAAQTLQAQQVAQQLAAESTRAQAGAQRDLAQAQAGRESFLSGLREQIALYGRSTEEVLRYRAAQAGATQEAAQLILQLQNMRAAQNQAAEAAHAQAAAQQQAAQAETARNSFLDGLREQIALFGRSTEEVQQYRAAQLGAANAAAPLIAQLRALREAQEQAAVAARAAEQAQRDAASAQAKQDNFVASLREQIALFGKSTDEVLRYQAAQAGAAAASEPLIVQLRALRDAQDQAAAAARAAEQAQRDAQQAQARKDSFIADLREQVALYGLATEEVQRYRAAQLGLTAAAEPFIAQLRAMRTAQDQATAAARAAEQAQREALQVQAGKDSFLAGLREQVALFGLSTEEAQRYRAAQLGLTSAAEPFIAQLQAMRVAQEQVAAAARATAQAQREADQAQAGRDSFIKSLEQQANAIGKTRLELIELHAAQLGVTTQAQPFVERLRAAEREMQNGGLSAAAMAAALRGVPAQMTDIIVSLQGGQAPLTVFLQQGGQLRDMFGSASVAAKALGNAFLGLITPYTVAIAAIGTLTYAYKAGHDESIEYARALAATNNIAGTTTGQMGDMAYAIGDVAGSQHKAAAALAELAATGAIAGRNLQAFGTVVVEAQHVLGKSVEDTAKEFADLGKSPLTALQSIGDKYHFITAETYAAVKAAQEQGRTLEAAEIAQRAYADGISQQRQKVLDSLSDWERGWLRIKKATSGAWDAVIGFAGGREKTDSEKINDLLADRDEIQESLNRAKARGLAADVAAYQAQLNVNEREINNIRQKGDAKKQAAASDAAAVRADELRNKWLGESNVLLTRQQLLERELNAARTEGAANGLSDEEIQNRLLVVRRKYNDVYTTGIDTSITALRRRAEIEGALDQRALAMIQAQRSLGSISEDDAINRTAQIELAALDRQKKLMQDQLGMVRSKINSQREQADIEGQIAVLGEQRRSREQQQKNELLALDDRRYRAAVEHSANLIEKEMDERNSLIQQTQAQIDYNEQIGLTQKQVTALAAARLAEAAARKDVEADIAEGFDLTGERAARIREEAMAIRERAAALIEGGEKQASYDRWKSAVDQYGQVFQQGFADMLNEGKDGWSSFTKSLVTTFKTSVADQIYKMFTRPIIVQLVGNYLGVSPTAIAGEIAGQPNAYGVTSASAAGGNGLISAAQMASSLYKAVSSGFSSIGTSIGQGISSLGNAVGSQSMSAFGGGMQGFGLDGSLGAAGGYGAMASSIATGVSGALAGYGIGRAISGDYKAPGSNAVTAIASAVGSYILPGIGGVVGGALGGLYNRAFGMGSKEVTTTGISGTLSSTGTTASSYSKWHQDGGWFRSDKNGTDSTAFSGDTLAALTNGLNQLKAVSSSFADSLGVDAASISSYTKSFNIDLGKDGSIEDGITKLLTGVGDEIATRLVPNIMQFAKTGESASTVLERLSGDFTATTLTAQLLGKTAVEAFGSAGIASAAARERLVELAGSTSALTSLASSYAQNYLTEAERLAPVKAAVDEAMGSLGLAGVQTREQFKQVVNSLDLTTEAGAKQFTAMMQLADAFAQVHAAAEDLTKTESQILEERRSLQDQLDQLTMTSTQLLKKRRDALAEANRPLFDMIQAAQKLTDMSSGLTSFRDSLLSLRDGLLTGSLSTLNPEQQYAELRAQYEKTRAAALGGDTKAQDAYSSALTAFLTASQKINSGDSQYQADFAMGLKDSAAMASWATGQIDTAQAQLNAMSNTNAALDTANKILDTIAQNTAPAVQSGYVLNNAFSVLSTALKSLQKSNDDLKTEVAGLRADQQAQTGDTITSNEKTQQSAAQTMVNGVVSAVARLATSNQKVALE